MFVPWRTKSTAGRLVRDAVVVSLSLFAVALGMRAILHRAVYTASEDWLQAIAEDRASRFQHWASVELRALNALARSLRSNAEGALRAKLRSVWGRIADERDYEGLAVLDADGKVLSRAGSFPIRRVELTQMSESGYGYVGLLRAGQADAQDLLLAVELPRDGASVPRWLAARVPTAAAEAALGFAGREVEIHLVADAEGDLSTADAHRWVQASVSLSGLAGRIVARAHASSLMSRVDTWDLQLTAILVLVAAFLMASALHSRKRIVEPLRHGVEVAEELARGNLGVVMEIQGDEEIADILRALQRIRERFTEVIGKVKLNVISLNAGSEQLSAASQELSQRVQEQASIVQQSRATFEQMRDGITRTAESASEVRERVEEVSQAVARGLELGESANESLRHFMEHAKEMTEITKLVNEMAFQTNLLALNASVEAARAGEQGRGFAVVAGEIRNLAQRSAEGAKRIQEMIDVTLREIQGTTEQAESLKEALHTIAEKRERVSALVTDIASEMQEQAAAINQLTGAVAQLDEVAQRNAAFVEELASSSEELAAGAQELQSEVDFFKVQGVEGDLGGSSQAGGGLLSSGGRLQRQSVSRVDRFAGPGKEETRTTDVVRDLDGFEEF